MGVAVTIGLEMPPDFEVSVYNSVNAHAELAMNGDQEKLSEFWAGWNAVAHRFASCTSYGNAFADSVREYGDSPLPAQRHDQEQALFGFFVSGLSTLDSLAYAVWFICAMKRPERFPASSPQERKAIILPNLRDKMLAEFDGDSLAVTLRAICSSTQFCQWKEIRNVLAHRSSPPRTFFAGNAGPAAVWNTSLGPIVLDERMVESRLAWLASTTSEAVRQVDGFLAKHFGL